LFSRSSGFHQVTSFLRDGHLVGVLSDQRAGRKGLLTPFFGRLSSCSGLPELLARRTNALLVSTSVATIGPGRWRVRYRPIEDPSTAGIMDALASSMSDSLPDVFWLHDRWRIDRTRPLDFYVKRPAVQHPDWITKPFRLLLSCRGLGPEAWITIEEILAARTDVEIDLLDDGTTFIPGPHPRVRRIAFDPSLPTKHLAGQLRRLDRDRPAPLDAAVLLDGDRQLGAACRKAGLRAVVGTTRDPVGPPWTATVLPAADYSLGPFGWRHLAYIVGAVPLVPPS
jgi:KDO2-lipid IV(A) lauroyltransferase